MASRTDVCRHRLAFSAPTLLPNSPAHSLAPPTCAPSLRPPLHRPHRTVTRTCLNAPSTSPSAPQEPEPEPEPTPQPSKTTPTAHPSSSTDSQKEYEIKVIKSMADIPVDTWDSFAKSGCDNPFLRHAWLSTLEQSESVHESTGWITSHLVISDPEPTPPRVVALIPAYLKTHSLGEFVFDQQWAEIAYAVGINYYPKLLVGVPFTPAAGRRILTRDEPETDRQAVLNVCAKLLVRLCHFSSNISSVHVNFCRPDEVSALRDAGFMHRKGIQYHFTNYRKGKALLDAFEANQNNPDYALDADKTQSSTHAPESRDKYRDFSDYLNEFKSKKRIKMKRERQVAREESGVRIEVLRGADITPQVLDDMFHMYKATIDKLLYGRQYLTREFFTLLSEQHEFRDNHLCLIVARRPADGNRIIAGTFNVIGGNDEQQVFYGRYWGCVEEVRFLHFETCYYAAIEHCIDQALARMEPGAGGGDFKYVRGFEPCVTHSMHYIKDRRLANAIDRYLAVEGVHVDGAVSELTQQSAIRAKTDDNDVLEQRS